MSENQINTGPSGQLRTGRLSYGALIVVPIILFLIIVSFAPNFVTTDSVRHDPLGGDFLQEYAGGVLFRDASQNNQLYNVDVCREIQHDANLLGFQWEESRFFPMVYPPFYYAAVSPLSTLEYLTATRVWLLLMTACLVASLLLLRRQLQLHTGFLLLSCLAAPVLLSLTTGQKSTVLLLILTATWAAWRKDKPFAAGAIFGLIAFKPHLGIPVGLFMLARKQWSFVMGCYFTVGCLIVGSLATGFDICTDYFSVTMGFTDYVQSGGYHLEQGFSLWSAWQLSVSDPTTAKILTTVSSLVILIGTIIVLRRSDCHRTANRARGFSAMIIATVLLAPHLYAYDLAILVLPALLLGNQAKGDAQNKRDAQNKGESLDKATLVPVAALLIVLFGMNPLISIGSMTGLNLGVPLLVVAWAGALQLMQSKPAAVAVPRIEPEQLAAN